MSTILMKTKLTLVAIATLSMLSACNNDNNSNVSTINPITNTNYENVLAHFKNGSVLPRKILATTTDGNGKTVNVY